MSSAFVVLNETRLTSRLLLYRSSAERWAGVRLVILIISNMNRHINENVRHFLFLLALCFAIKPMNWPQFDELCTFFALQNHRLN